MKRLAVAGLLLSLCVLAGCSCHRPGYYDPVTGIIYEDVSCAPPLGFGFTQRLAYTFNKHKRQSLCHCNPHCSPQSCGPSLAHCSACGGSYLPGQPSGLGGYPAYGHMPMQAMPGEMIYGGVIDGGVIDGGVIDGGTMQPPQGYDAAPPKAPAAESPENGPAESPSPTLAPAEPDAVSIDSAVPLQHASMPAAPRL